MHKDIKYCLCRIWFTFTLSRIIQDCLFLFFHKRYFLALYIREERVRRTARTEPERRERHGAPGAQEREKNVVLKESYNIFTWRKQDININTLKNMIRINIIFLYFPPTHTLTLHSIFTIFLPGRLWIRVPKSPFKISCKIPEKRNIKLTV